MLSDMGYEIKNASRSEGKYLAIKPMGLMRFRRCKSLGENYTEERIRERIETENLSTYRKLSKEQEPKIIRCRVKRYRRAKMSGVQKKYFARLYRLGLLKKRPYSQAWKYRDDIRKMQKLQEDYLFLVRHDVKTAAGVAVVAESMTDKKKDTSREKSRIFKERARMKPLFDIVAELRELELCYKRGEVLFQKEHERYTELSDKLSKEGYSVEQIDGLKQHYKNEIARVRDKEKAVAKEERIAKRILADLMSTDTGKEQSKEKEQNKEVEKSRQPIL